MTAWLIVIISLLTIEATGLTVDYRHTCHADLPFTSVGDFKLTRSNFDR